MLSMVMPERAFYANFKTWHARLGRSSPKEIIRVSINNVAGNLQSARKSLLNVCEVCSMFSQTCSSVREISDSRAARIIELVYSDACETIETVTDGGARYFVTVIDHFSKWTSLFPIKKIGTFFVDFKIFLPGLCNKLSAVCGSYRLIKRASI